MSLGRSFEERPKLEAQFFRNFSCCGLDLQDLHGLLEHFEECHVAFEDDGATDGGMEVEMEMDDGGSEGTISGPPSPRMHHGGAPRSVYELKKSALSSGFDAGSPSSSPASLAMELDMDMDDTPPFHLTSPHQALSSHASTSSLSNNGNGTVTPSAAYRQPPMSAFDSPLQNQNGINKKKFSTAMNVGSMRGIGMGMGGMMGLEALAAARTASAYSTPDSSIPGTPVMEEVPGGGVDGLFSVPAGSSSIHLNPHAGLAPSLLFPGTPAESPPSDDNVSNAGSNSNGSGRDSIEGTPSGGVLSALPSALHPLGTGVQISPSGRPYTPPSEKPFKCSVAGCDKSYKQQNGLKYHRLHGHCNQNNVGKEGMESRGEGKPYVCHVTSCGKRYKNMNGLRYHYQHSGAHGALGLQMLAQGCHPAPEFPAGHKRSATGSASTSRAGSPSPSTGGASDSTSRQTSPVHSFPRGVGVGMG